MIEISRRKSRIVARNKGSSPRTIVIGATVEDNEFTQGNTASWLVQLFLVDNKFVENIDQ